MKTLILFLGFIIFRSGLYSQNTDTVKTWQLEQKATELYETFKFDSSAHCYFQAAEIYAQQENWINVVKNYRLTANSFNKTAKADTALYFAQKALDIANINFIEKTNDETLEQAEVYITLGDTYYKLATYDQELFNYEKALNFVVKSDSLSKLKVAEIWNNIGLAHNDLGQYKKAIECCEKSLNIRQELLGINNIEVAKSLENLGLLFSNMGEYNKAIEYDQKALQIKIQKLGEQHPYVAYSYNKIGNIFLDIGDNDKALEYINKALQINIQNYGEQHSSVAHNYQGIGIVYKEKGNYDKALEYFNKALKINIQIYGEQHPFVASNYNNIGNVFKNKGDYVKALEYLQKTLFICIQSYGEHHPRVALIYNNIGNLYYMRCGYDNALQYYQKALIANLIDFNDSIVYHNPEKLNTLSKPFLLSNLNSKAKALYSLFNLEHSIDDLHASISTYNIAFNLVHEIRTDYSNESTQLLLSEDTKFMYAEAILVAIELNKKEATKENREKVFEFMEKSKNATLSAYLNNMELKQFSNIADSLLEKEKDIISNRRNYETKIQQAKSQKGGHDTLLVQDYQNKLFDYSRMYDSLMNTMEQNYPDYFTLKYQQKTARIEDIQLHMDKNSALINYFVGDTSLFICVITKEEYAIEAVKTDSMFNEKIFDYYIDIKSDFTEKELKYSSYLYNYLIEPIEEHIQNKSNLIIIPDGNLYYVPFETLCKNYTYSEDLSALSYLIKSYSVTYHHTASLWLNSKKKTKNQLATQDNFIGFAPVFDPKIDNGFIVSGDWMQDTSNTELATRSVSKDFTHFNPLKYSEKEVKSIVNIFNKNGKEAKGFFYQEANEKNFKKNAQNYKYIHIASHSFTNDIYPNLSGIAFSQPDTNMTNKEIYEDGILYAGETYNLNLDNADLIVLSSCKSGLGKLIQGEGFLSLTRGFVYSGAPNIMFSIWNVNDEQTKDLMIQFYESLQQGTDYTSALRKAKLQLINDPKTALPKYWGAWILVGR